MVRKLFYAYLEIKQALCIARTYYRIEAQLMWYVLNLLSLPGNCAKWKSFCCRGGNMELVVVVQSQSCVQLLQPLGLQPTRLLCSWDFPGKNTRVGCHFLLQGIFQTQGLNQCLLHYRQILHRLSHQGSLAILSQENLKLFQTYMQTGEENCRYKTDRLKS